MFCRRCKTCARYVFIVVLFVVSESVRKQCVRFHAYATTTTSIALSVDQASDFFLRSEHRIQEPQQYSFRVAESIDLFADANAFSLLTIDPTSGPQDIYAQAVDPTKKYNTWAADNANLKDPYDAVQDNVYKALSLNIVVAADALQGSNTADDEVVYDPSAVAGGNTVERTLRVSSFADTGVNGDQSFKTSLTSWPLANSFPQCKIMSADVSLSAGFLNVYESAVDVMFANKQPLLTKIFGDSMGKPALSSPSYSKTLIYVVDCEPAVIVTMTPGGANIYMGVWQAPFEIAKTLWYNTKIPCIGLNDFVVTNTRILVATTCGTYVTLQSMLNATTPMSFVLATENVFTKLLYTPYCDCPSNDPNSNFDSLFGQESSETYEKPELVIAVNSSNMYMYSFSPFLDLNASRWRFLGPRQLILSKTYRTNDTSANTPVNILGVNEFINTTITDDVFAVSFDPWHQLLSVIYKNTFGQSAFVSFLFNRSDIAKTGARTSAIIYDSSLSMGDGTTQAIPTHLFTFRNNLFVATTTKIFTRSRQFWLQVFDSSFIKDGSKTAEINTLLPSTLNNEILILLSTGVAYSLGASHMQIHKLGKLVTPLPSIPTLTLLKRRGFLAAFSTEIIPPHGAKANDFFDVLSIALPDREVIDSFAAPTNNFYGLLFQPMSQQRVVFYGIRKPPLPTTKDTFDDELLMLDASRMSSAATPEFILRYLSTGGSQQQFYFSYHNHILTGLTTNGGGILSNDIITYFNSYFVGYVTQKLPIVASGTDGKLEMYPVHKSSQISSFTGLMGRAKLTLAGAPSPPLAVGHTILLMITDGSSPIASSLIQWRLTAFINPSSDMNYVAPAYDVYILPYPNTANAMKATSSDVFSSNVLKWVVVDFRPPQDPPSPPTWQAEVSSSCSFLLNLDTPSQLALDVGDSQNINVELWRSPKDFDQLVRLGGLRKNFDGELIPALYLVTPGGLDSSLVLSFDSVEAGNVTERAILNSIASTASSAAVLAPSAKLTGDAAAGIVSSITSYDPSNAGVATNVETSLIGGADAGGESDMLDFLTYQITVQQTGKPNEMFSSPSQFPSKLDLRIAPRNEQCQYQKRRHESTTAPGTTTIWIKSSCPPSTAMQFVFPVPLTRDIYTRDITLFQTLHSVPIMQAIPVNYRPPGAQGLSRYDSTNVYNVDPAQDIPDDYGRAQYVLQNCANAATQEQCGCTVDARMLQAITNTDCIDRAYRVSLAKNGAGYSENLTLTFQIYDMDTNVVDVTHPDFVVWIEEMNGRIGWMIQQADDTALSLVREALIATGQLPDVPVTDDFTPDQRKIALASGSTMFFEQQGLFHFRATIMQNFSFCNLQTEFLVYTADPPLQYPIATFIQYFILAVFIFILHCLVTRHGKYALSPWKPGSRRRPMVMPYKTQMRTQQAMLDEKAKKIADKEAGELMREYNQALFEQQRRLSRTGSRTGSRGQAGSSSMSFMRATKSFVN